MNKFTMQQYISLTIILLIFSNASHAMGKTPDPQFQRGEDTHDDHCYKCHSDDIYTRDDSFVKSINALGTQVRRCKDGSGAPWFDEDTDAVIHFLNKKYYKF